jgi:hypothetical protein
MDNQDEAWEVVFKTNTDYEAEIVRDRLDDAGLPAIVDTKRDHAFFLTVGDLAQVMVRVPKTYADEARRILASRRISDADLELAALAADPDAVGITEDDIDDATDNVDDDDRDGDVDTYDDDEKV